MAVERSRFGITVPQRGTINARTRERANCHYLSVIEVRVVTADAWRAWRQLRLSALAQAPAAFGSTLAQWSGPGDIEERWCARLATSR